jgi:hypothetical protein
VRALAPSVFFLSMPQGPGPGLGRSHLRFRLSFFLAPLAFCPARVR